MSPQTTFFIMLFTLVTETSGDAHDNDEGDVLFLLLQSALQQLLGL